MRPSAGQNQDRSPRTASEGLHYQPAFARASAWSRTARMFSPPKSKRHPRFWSRQLNGRHQAHKHCPQNRPSPPRTLHTRVIAKGTPNTQHCRSSPCTQLAFLAFCWGTSRGLALCPATALPAPGALPAQERLQFGYGTAGTGKTAELHLRLLSFYQKASVINLSPQSACSGCDLNPKDACSYRSVVMTGTEPAQRTRIRRQVLLRMSSGKTGLS